MDKFKHVGFQTMTTFYGVCILSEWPPANIFEYDFESENIISHSVNNQKKRSGSAGAVQKNEDIKDQLKRVNEGIELNLSSSSDSTTNKY